MNLKTPGMYLNILLTNFYLNITLVSDENEMFEAYKLLLNQMKTQTGKVFYKDYHKILLMAVRYGNTSSLEECLSGRNMCFRKGACWLANLDLILDEMSVKIHFFKTKPIFRILNIM